MLSLVFAHPAEDVPAPRTTAADTHGVSGEFYYCPACEVYGRGSECWWCGDPQVEWTHAPEPRALPTRIHARAVLSTWPRSTNAVAGVFGCNPIDAGLSSAGRVSR